MHTEPRKETHLQAASCELFRRCLGHGGPGRLLKGSTRANDNDRQHDWVEFIRRYEGRLRSTLRKTFDSRRTEADIDDCLQDFYLRLLNLDTAAFRGRTEEQLRAFLDQMARRLACDRQRSLRLDIRRRRHPWAHEAGFVGSSARPVQERRLIARQRIGGYLQCCRRVLESSFSPQEAIDLRFRALRLALVDGYSSREIARQMGGRLSPTQIDSMLHRLRRKLSSYGIVIHRRGRCGSFDTMSR